MLGVEYPDSFLANPKNWRTRPCVALIGPAGTLIVDCPPEMRLQCRLHGVQHIDAVLITHSHADHVMGMDDLRSITMRTGRGMPVYALPRYQDDIRRIFKYAFDALPATLIVPRFELRDVPETLDVCGLRLSTFTVLHGTWPVTAFRVNDFAYITDVSEIPEPEYAKLRGLDTLVLDGLRYEPHPNHFHYDQAIAVAQRIGAKQTYLTHLTHDYDHDVVNAQLPRGIELAYDGLRIGI